MYTQHKTNVSPENPKQKSREKKRRMTSEQEDILIAQGPFESNRMKTTVSKKGPWAGQFTRDNDKNKRQGEEIGSQGQEVNLGCMMLCR